MRKTAILVFSAALLAAPFIVSAQSTSTSSIQSEIQSLLQQIQQLEQQIQQLVASSSPAISTSSGNWGSGSGATASSTPGCFTPSRSLSYGSTGGDVSSLQTYLQGQGLLASSSVTGFFGDLTQGALQTWQSQQGIVSSGTASSTGWGVFGPRTMSAFRMRCGEPNPVPPGDVTVPPLDGSTPSSNAPNGLSANLTANGSDNLTVTLPAGSTTLNYNYTLAWSSTNASSCTLSFARTDGGTPTTGSNVVATSGSAQTGLIGSYTLSCLDSEGDQASDTVTITAAGSGGGIASSSVESFYASPASGGAPLPVTFTAVIPINNPGVVASPTGNYLINPGDGGSDIPVMTDQCSDGSCTYTANYTYQGDGVYSATLYQESSPSIPINCTDVACTDLVSLADQSVEVPLATITITVTGTAANSSTILTASPSSGSAPLTVTFGGQGPGADYMLDYGDGSPSVVMPLLPQCPIDDSPCTPGTVTFNETHTYTSAGMYTATLTSVNGTTTASITVSQ